MVCDFFEQFTCPYCGCTYERGVGCGTNYRYKGKIYGYVEWPCPKCGKDFLYGNTEDGDDKFIKMPVDRENLEFDSCWMA